MKTNSVISFLCFFAFIATVSSSETKITHNVSLKTEIVNFPEGILFGSFCKEDGPFLFEGTIIVPSGQILEFGPGCQIFIGGQNSSIIVYGQIFVRGNKDEPVVFMSANEKSNPWDWNRIYCRSDNRSVFDFCTIRNSNYGLVVENGIVSIRNCIFENNSLHGLVVKNSDVDIKNSIFRGGHISAINLLPGAKCEAESLFAQNNITALSCHERASINLQGGSVSENTNGFVFHPASSITSLYTSISGNKNGIVSTSNIPSKSREMVFGNAFDLKIVNPHDLDRLLNIPLAKESNAFPQNTIFENTNNDIKPGFSALNKPAEPVSDFLGNVTAGFKYFRPKSFKNPSDDSVLVQSHYPENFQPEIQVFANGRRSGADINLLMDIYGNDWLSTQGYVDKRFFNLSLTYAQQQIQFGDFFENGSETSISGRQITGVKYSGQFKEIGAGMKRFNLTLAAGESEVPKDSGDHEINIYNETVDSGMSIRQQLTYLASLTVKPTRNSSITTKGIISRDQTEKPLFRSPIDDPAVNDPVEAQTGCIEGNVSFLDEKLEIFAELDLGTSDTISEKSKHVAWYNPDFKKAIPEIFSLFGNKDFFDHYAFTLGTKSTINGYKFLLSGTQIAPDFFSAGNPYLETDRRSLVLSAEKQFKKELTVTARYDYRKSSISKSPYDNNTFNIYGEYTIAEHKPVFSIDYSCQFDKMKSSERVETEDSSFNVYYHNKSISNIVSFETKQNFRTGIDYGIRYQFLYDNDISKHADHRLNDNGDRFQNQIRSWLSFRIKNYLRNRLTIRLANRIENRDSLEAFSYKFQNHTSWNIIPRKLTLNVTGEYSHGKETDIYTTNNPVVFSYYKSEVETKYSISPRLSLSVMGSYEKSYDETAGSAENYDAVITGMYLTCLF